METQDQIEKGIPRLVDTHAHLNFFDYEKDWKETIERSLGKGVWMINIGTNFQSSQRAITITEEYSTGIFAAIGLHPTNIEYEKFKLFSEKGIKKPENFLEKDFDIEGYENLAKNKKVVAIGEIGLDYFYKPKDLAELDGYKAKQKEIFEKQLDSKELGAHSDQVTVEKTLPIAGLEPGKYKVTIKINDAISNQEIAQSAPFVVE